MTKDTWKVVNKKILVKTPYFEVWQDEIENPDGKIRPFYAIRKKPYSMIIPLFENSAKTLLVYQYRPAIKAYSWEFPMGYVPEKSPREIAEIELSEETGATAKTFKEIGRFWQSNGSSNQIGHVYVAEEVSLGEAHPETGEFVTWKTFSLQNVREMIENGTIMDTSTITGYHFLEIYLRK